MLTEKCNSRLTGDTEDAELNDDKKNKNNAAFIGVGIAVIIMILAAATIAILIHRRRNINRERLVVYNHGTFFSKF